jgi:sulfur carrier protein ThiS
MRMKILFINNDGGGFADTIEIAQGTTVAKLFAERLPDADAGDYLIRVNRQPCTGEQALQDGDRVSMTPVKIDGAAQPVKVLFINNDGGGFADYIELAAGTTINKLFAQQVPGGDPAGYLIRVNRLPAARDQVLQDGDRVSMTPVKIDGAVIA